MKRTLLMVVLGVIAAAIGVVIGVRSTPDSYIVMIHNSSPHTVSGFRIFGAGCDEHFDPIQPDETVKRTFVIVKEGKLELTGNGETANGPATYDKIIDDHVEKGREGMSTITVDEDGDVSAIAEKGN